MSISHFEGARNPNLGLYVAGSQHNKLIGTADGSHNFMQPSGKDRDAARANQGIAGY